MKEDKLNILFDSNIIIDCFTKREGSEDSIRCFRLMANGKYNGYLVSKQITDIDYVLRKYFDINIRKEVINKLLTLFFVVDLTKDELYRALTMDGNDFEDNVLSSCAEVEKMDFILTKDKRGFANSKTTPITPTLFLKNVKS